MTENKREEKKEKNEGNMEIPGMDLNAKYSAKQPVIPLETQEMQKAMEKTRKDLEKLKSTIVKKYPFTQAIGILPPQSIKIFAEDSIVE